MEYNGERKRLLNPSEFYIDPFYIDPTVRQPGAARDIQIQKERMPTFVDILFALQVGLEPTTP